MSLKPPSLDELALIADQYGLDLSTDDPSRSRA